LALHLTVNFFHILTILKLKPWKA